ncbi:MAG: type IV pilus inner membrane component PilO [Acidiferrobacter sp.]
MDWDWRQTLDDLKNVDINNLGASPYPVKLIGVAVAGVLLLLAGYWFVIRGEIEHYDALRVGERSLKQEFIQQKRLAIELPAYERQMKDMRVAFRTLLEELPNTTHMPEFVTEVTQAGKSCGLRFILLRPKHEKLQAFYAELPIQLTVAGTYSQLGHFVGDIAALPRIVTLGNVRVAPKTGGDLLTMSMIAKTYRYMAKAAHPVKR